MQDLVRTKAEERFAAARKKEKRALSEVDKERQEIAKRTVKLRDLRLAKEAADRQAAEEAAAAKAAAGPKKKTKPKAEKKPAPTRRVY